MISVSLSLFGALAVGVPLLVVGAMALYYSLRSLHRPAGDRESIYECTRCGHVYALDRRRPMDRCPRCGHLNDAVRA